MDTLTPKQRLFVMEYLTDLNATQSAIRAGYSAKAAQEQGARLLSKVMVKKAIDKAMQSRIDTIERSASEVLRDISDVAKTAKSAFMDNPENASMASVALKALELEGKHYGLFVERIEVTTIKIEKAPMTILFED